MIARYKRPDAKNAQSIIESAKRDMDFTLSLPIKEEAGTTIIRNIYESFRMLGDALLTAQGGDGDHITQINELLKLQVKTSRPIQLIDNLRQLRHNMNYYGYKPNLAEVRDVISLAESCFEPLYKEVKKKINSS
jgi:hypothetical protein